MAEIVFGLFFGVIGFLNTTRKAFADIQQDLHNFDAYTTQLRLAILQFNSLLESLEAYRDYWRLAPATPLALLQSYWGEQWRDVVLWQGTLQTYLDMIKINFQQTFNMDRSYAGSALREYKTLWQDDYKRLKHVLFKSSLREHFHRKCKEALDDLQAQSKLRFEMVHREKLLAIGRELTTTLVEQEAREKYFALIRSTCGRDLRQVAIASLLSQPLQTTAELHLDHGTSADLREDSLLRNAGKLMWSHHLHIRRSPQCKSSLQRARLSMRQEWTRNYPHGYAWSDGICYCQESATLGELLSRNCAPGSIDAVKPRAGLSQIERATVAYELLEYAYLFHRSAVLDSVCACTIRAHAEPPQLHKPDRRFTVDIGSQTGGCIKLPVCAATQRSGGHCRVGDNLIRLYVLLLSIGIGEEVFAERQSQSAVETLDQYQLHCRGHQMQLNDGAQIESLWRDEDEATIAFKESLENCRLICDLDMRDDAKKLVAFYHYVLDP